MISIYINHTDCVLRGFTPVNPFAKGRVEADLKIFSPLP